MGSQSRRVADTDTPMAELGGLDGRIPPAVFLRERVVKIRIDAQSRGCTSWVGVRGEILIVLATVIQPVRRIGKLLMGVLRARPAT